MITSAGVGTRWWITGIGAGIALCAWLVNPTLAGAGLAVALVGAVLWWRYHRSRSAGLVTRWSRRSRRNDGVASVWAILRVGSSWAVRRKTRVLRPSLAGVPRWRRWRTPIRELATPLARVGMLRVWSPIEDVTVGLGGPRCGKTGELCCRILDAPGAVIATSTRTDLIEHTAHGRGRWGRPVGVFNPSGVGGVPSTITFSPLAGCADPTVATARATDLLSATAHPASGDAEHWLSLARMSLAPLLHAAALGDGTMWDVRAWIADPERAEVVVLRLLARSRTRVFDSDAEQFFTTGDRTRASICATIMPCLAWLTDPHADAAARAGGFDVAALLRARGTVYLLGAEDAQVAPLVTALTGHIAREARRIAGTQPKGRLDPPLTLALDEAALICPIPLDRWTADMGGRNITIHIRVQSRAQLRQRWGDVGAAAILNNAATVLIFGGTRDSDDLAAYSVLTGDRYEQVDQHSQRVPVLSAAQIAQLPAGHAVLIRRGLAPVIGRPLMVWRRRRVLRHMDVVAEKWATVRARRRQRQLPPTRKPIAALPAVDRPDDQPIRVVPSADSTTDAA